MDIKRMLDVVHMRFSKWNPVTSMFGKEEDGFRVEFDNYNKSGRILLRGKVKFESLDAVERFQWDVKGDIFEQDKSRIVEIQKVIANALV
jgi:hypothetical protein